LLVVHEIEKDYLTYKQSQKEAWYSGKKHGFGMLRKHGTLDWISKVPNERKPQNAFIKQKPRLPEATGTYFESVNLF